MTPEAKVNAVTRLIVLLTIIGYLLTLSYICKKKLSRDLKRD
jgi:hypothetical protein